MSWTNPNLEGDYDNFVSDVERRLGLWEDAMESVVRDCYDKGMNVTQTCKKITEPQEKEYDGFIEQYNSNYEIKHTMPMPMEYLDKFLNATAECASLRTVAIFKITLKGETKNV